MPSITLGPQRYGIGEMPVFIALVYRLAADEHGNITKIPVRRDEVGGIWLTHLQEGPEWNMENFLEPSFTPVPDLDRVSIPKESLLGEIVESGDAFAETPHSPFPYNFIFVPSDLDLLTRHGDYRTIIEIEKMDGTPSEMMTFSIHSVQKFGPVRAVFGEALRFVGAFYVKAVEESGIVGFGESTLVTQVFRSVISDGNPVEGQNRLPIEISCVKQTKLDVPDAFSGSGVAAFPYNFEHTPSENIFPAPGQYTVRFEMFAGQLRVGVVEIIVEVV